MSRTACCSGASAAVLALAMLLHAPAVQANDPALLIREIGRVLEQGERASQLRRQQEEQREAQEARQRAAERAERERTAALQRQQKAEQDAATRKADVAAMQAPPEWAGRLVLHRRALEAPEPAAPPPPPDLVVDARSVASLSPQGQWLAWENAAGTLELRNLRDGSQRSLGRAAGKHSRSLAFVGESALLIHDYEQGSELVDMQGNTLQRFAKGGYYPQPRVEPGPVAISHVSGRESLRCDEVLHYDARGQVLERIRVPGADACAARVDAQGRTEVLVHQDGQFTRHVQGQVANQFAGDTRSLGQYAQRGLHWLGQTPYAVSDVGNWNSSTHRFRLWDTVQGRLLCELPGHILGRPMADESGEVYVRQPAARLNVQDCSLTRVGTGPGVLTLLKEGAVLHDYESGRIQIFDRAQWQLRASLETPFRKAGATPGNYYPHFQATPGAPERVLLSVGSEDTPGWLIDLSAGRLVAQVPPGMRWGEHLLHYSHDSANSLWRNKVWRWREPEPAAAGLDDFLKAMRKDRYETTAEHRVRVAALARAHSLTVKLHDYDADRARFTASWREQALTLPMPPAQARRLDGLSEVRVQGLLSVLDDDFVELREASVQMPDGSLQRLALPAGPAPARVRAAASERAATPATAASVPGSAGAATPLPALARSAALPAAPGACSATMAHLAPQLRAYRAPALAEARQAILDLQPAKVLGDLRRKGATQAQLQQQAQQLEQSAREAATTARQSDGGGNSIRAADAGQLALDWPCEGIHPAAVCAYVAMRWEALVMQELARQWPQCTAASS